MAFYLGKHEFSQGKVAFYRVTDFTSGKLTQEVYFHGKVTENNRKNPKQGPFDSARKPTNEKRSLENCTCSAWSACGPRCNYEEQ